MNGSSHDLSLLLFITAVPYIVLMFRVLSGLACIKKWTPGGNEKIKVSVIITTNKNADTLHPLLNDLYYQNYVHNSFEVIIADDSKGLLKSDQLFRGNDVEVKVIPNSGSGKKSAIHNGIIAAGGELIITTDDDCRVGPGWINAITSFFKEKHPDLILCPVELDDNKTLFGRMQQLEFLSLQGVTAGTAANGDPIMCNGAAMAFRNKVFPENGLGKTDALVSGDDVFLLHYLKKTGAHTSWLESEDAIVHTAPSADIKSFIKQRARWASKAGSYRDASTIITGFSVLLLSFVIIFSLVLSIFNSSYFPIAIYLIVIKSIPDILIVHNRSKMHKNEKLLWYFPLVQLIYPFYVFISVFTGIFKKKKW
jgi:cellulose synthase/poly-beta-1,6-N-acetylglucosamine synthase-like glycosyltransferase